MALETVTDIDDLVITNPTASDPKSQGDDHVRNIKTALKNGFPGFTGTVLVGGTTSGSSTAYTLTPSTAVPALTDGMIVVCEFHAANTTTAPTLNISGLGAKTITNCEGGAVLASDLASGRYAALVYDGTNLQLLAVSKNYVDQLAFAAVDLPAQAGNANKFLKTDGTNSSWGYPGVLDRRAITTTDTVGVADTGVLIECTSGTFTLAFAAAATLGDQASGWIWNSGSGEVTLDPSGAETIDGLTSYIMYSGECRRWYVEGSAIKTKVEQPFFATYTASGTFTQPPGYKATGVVAIGGGGGGGSGYRGAAGIERSGGSAGGGGARSPAHVLPGLTAGTGYTITVGAAGTGGAAVSADSTAGNAGTAGGNSSFSTLVFAYGGGAGFGGLSPAPSSGGGGGGSAGAGGNGASGAVSAGGMPSQATLGGTTTPQNRGTGGGAGLNGSTAGSAEWGGGAGGGCTNVSVAGAGGSSVYGSPGGGAGGGINAANTALAGAAAGACDSFALGGGAAGGAATGAAGTAGTAGVNGKNGSSGGGGGAGAGAGGAGGAGAAPGGAGGGGAASVNGNASGAGGAGARGEVQVWGVV